MEVQGKRRMSRAQDAASIIPTIHIDGLTRNDMTVDSRDGACDILRLRHPVLAASCACDILCLQHPALATSCVRDAKNSPTQK